MQPFYWLKTLSVCLALGATGVPALAFDTLASDFAFSNLQRKLLDKRTAQQSSRGVGTADAMAAVRFTSDPVRTQANLQTFIDRTYEPQAKADLQRLVQVQPLIIQDIGNAMRSRYDLDPNSFADVYAAWWITAWQIAAKHNQDPARATAIAVSDQVRAALVDTPEFLSMSNEMRQQTAEALLLQALLMSEASLQGIDNPTLQNRIADAVIRFARSSGIDLTAMQLTPDGFVLLQ